MTHHDYNYEALSLNQPDQKSLINQSLGIVAWALNVLRIFCLTLAATFLTTFPVMAQGITVPSGSSLNVNNGQLNVSGGVTNAGTLLVTTGTINLSGSWANSGTFTAGTGTVNFNGASGTQTLNTGGLAQAFYNLTHSGASTVQLSTNPVDVNNDFSNTAGTFNAGSVNMTVANDWTNSATFAPGTGTVTFDGTGQQINGSSSFYTFVKQVAAADTLTFDNTGEQIIANALTLQGAASNLLSLRSDSGGNQWNITLQSGGSQNIQYVDVQDSNAGNGVTLNGGTTSTNSGNNTNWLFGAATITWDGSASTNWNDPFNWDLGLVPTSADTVVIPSGPVNQPALVANTTVLNLTINSGASLTLDGRNLTVTTTFANSGNVNLQGIETLTLTQDTDSGTFTYVGNNDGTADTRTIIDFGATDYFNLVINDPNVTKDIFQTNANLTLGSNLTVTGGTLNISTNTNTAVVPGTLTVNGGTLTATNGNLDVNGGVTISSGTLTAPTGAATFTVAGNFVHSAGTFTPGTGTVTLDGTNQTLSGNTTFYNLSKTVAAAATLTFDNTATQTVTNALTLVGATGQLLSLVSDSPGNAANLSLQAGGLQNINFVNVTDNDASGGVTLVAHSTSTDGGGNTNWQFGAVTVTWDGSTSTDWDTASNWDLGIVPSSGDTVIIAAAGNQPVLATNVSVFDLTLQNATTLTLNGKNLAASGTFSNDGNVILQGLETVTLTQDTNSGTFTYVGNNDGTVDTRTVKDFGATDYYNLVINDPNATKDIFQTNGNLTLGNNLTLTTTALDISTNTNTLTAGGTVTLNGGTLTATNGNLDVDGSVTISSGTLTAPTGGRTFTLSGNFTHTAGTFTQGTGTVTLDGANQTITGSTTFYGLSKTVTSAATLTFDNTATQTVTNNLTLSGATGQLLSLVTDSAGNAANLTLQAGGTQSINFVDVRDNDASGGLTLIGRNSSVNSGNNTNWSFGSTTFTWDGSTNTDWDTASNWDLGLVPTTGDNVVIPSTVNQPVLATNVSINNLTLQASTTLTLNGRNLTAGGTFVNDGNVVLQGLETVTLTQDTDSGTFTYVGNNDVTVDTRTVKDFGATDYFNLVINDPNAVKDLFVTNANLTVANNLTLTTTALNISTNANTLTTTGTLSLGGGTLTATNGDIDANGSVSITSGTLTAPGSGNDFTVAGNFTHSGGTFTHSSGKVTFDDNGQSTTFVGDTTFFDFESTTASKILIFTAGTTQTVNGTFTLFGTSGSEIVLDSTSGGVDWNIAFPNGSQTVKFVDVQDSNALTNSVLCLSCNDGGNNNANWVFGSLQIDIPADTRTVGQTPILIGVGSVNSTVTIKDGSNAVVATATTDANGNFRVKLGEDQANLGTVTVTSLPVGAATLTPYTGVIPGTGPTLTVVASPSTSQVPIILTPADGSRLTSTTPTFTGQGLPGQAVTIYANDENGNLLLSIVGSGVVDGSGNYSVTATTALAKGSNFVSIVVNGVSSDINEYLLVDPYGFVFDSVSNAPITGAVVTVYKSDGTLAQPGVDLHPADMNPYTTLSDGFYNFNAVNGNYYMTVSAAGFSYPSSLTSFPGGRVIATGSKGETFTVAGVIQQIDHPLDGSPSLLRVEKVANKSEAKVGDIVTYTVTIENLSSLNSVAGALLNDKIPPGFKYVPNRVLLDGVPLTEPTGQRPVVFDIGSFTPSSTKTLRYQLIVGAGVGVGNYENSAFAKYSNGLVISNHATATVKIGIDPLFDAGTLIGKVFFDLNENGRQDAPSFDEPQQENVIEKPVPNVQLVMEDGTVVTTDTNGQFSLAGLTTGRHLLRVDERTLPAGAYFTTDKLVVLDVRPGLMNKVNFGINVDSDEAFSEDTQFFNERIQMIQSQEKPVPRLNIDLFNGELRMFNGMLIEPAEFRIHLNYSAFVETWKLEVLDRDTKKLVKKFEGTKFDINNPIYWDGRGDDQKIIREDRKYSYVLTLADAAKNQNTSQEKMLNIRIIPDEVALKAEKEKEKPEEYAKRYNDWLDALSDTDVTKLSAMRIEGETLQINPKGTNIRAVRVVQSGKLFADISAGEYRTTTAADLAEGKFRQQTRPLEFILPKGEYDIQVVSAGREAPVQDIKEKTVAGRLAGAAGVGSTAPAGPVNKYSKQVKVGDDYLMFVAMGDGQVGYNFDQGNVEPIQSADNYKKGFYQQGKMAYFLKGKIKGKYLVTSSFDSERQKKELFRTLDRETYYPIYGDQSSADYQATDTQGPLFLLVEWDKSSAIWGNYAVDFNNTEFAQFSRSYYGGKIDYETVAQTPYSEPRTKVVVFNAQIKQRSAHNEMLGTGGSLYYLKNKDVIEGSDRVRLEVRDQVTGLVVTAKDMKEGADYEIDYREGRILFWQPVTMMVRSDRLIGNNLVQGNPVYVVADYEYATIDKLSESSQGLRAQQAVTDQLTTGVTYVTESQASKNYELRAVDTTLHINQDARIKAEYAETESQDTGSFISTDGGLSFTELTVGDQETGKAYGLTGDARLFNTVGLQAYYKWIQDGFASVSTSSQQGKELMGFAMTWDMSAETRLTMRQDIQKLMTNANVQAELQVGAEETTTTAMQIIHEAGRLRLTGEFQNQQVTNKNQFETVADSDTSTVAGRADYALTPKTDVSLQHEAQLTGERGQQTTVGASTQLTDRLAIRGTESFGSKGTASSLGATVNTTGKLAIATDYTQAIDSDGIRTDTTTVGATAQMTEKVALNSTVSRSTSSDGKVTLSTAVGTQASTNLGGEDGTDVSVGVGVAQSNTGESTKTASVGASKQVDDQTAVSTSLSVSQDAANVPSSSLSLGAAKKVDEKTSSTAVLTVDQAGGESSASTLTLADSRKLNDEYEALVERSIGTSETELRKANKYALVRDKNGKRLEGSLTRQYADSPTEVSQSNIFGLSGDINDRWAMLGSLQRGTVQNHDGTTTDRTAISTGVGYVNRDLETGVDKLKSSTKVELRLDSGDSDRRQFVLYNANEGRITDAATIFTKLEYSKSEDTSSKEKLAGYKEIVLGAAYRPISMDKLNFITKYTYQENKSPAGQIDTATIDQQRAHVFSVDAIYDINERWQLAEKFAYRINTEKVVGFEFNKTHTWLMVHRLNYNVDRNWQVGGEYRKLTQVEAKDSKQGFLLEASRKINDFAKLGVGYNFTTFNDDLTNLNYTAQGPFLRVTGSAYDRTPEERKRARAKWLEERISRWAWKMVYNELKRPDSKVVDELNRLYAMADTAAQNKKFDESKQLYTDIVMAGQMMYEEASQFIREQIAFEEKMNQMTIDADEAFKQGELLKARQLWESVIDQAQKVTGS